MNNRTARLHGVRTVACLLAGAWMMAARPASAQHAHHGPVPPGLEHRPDVAAFVQQARAATERFRDRNEAVAAGYRLVGPDMPNMGQHWINISRVLKRPLDPARPSVLTYVPVGGQPVLTGVAYTVPLAAGELPSDFPFPGAWHFHTSTLTDEGFGLGMNGGRARTDHEGPRLAMIHAWIYTPNPHGLFAPDNWALSFVRLGISPPESPSSAAARALFLVAEGAGYYLDAIRHAAGLSVPEAEAVRTILERHQAELVPFVAAMRERGEATPEECAKLAVLWYALWIDVEAALPSVEAERLAPLKD